MTERALVVTTAESESDIGEVWLRAAAASAAFAFLADPVEDVYTVKDGEPFRDAVA